MRAIPDRNAVNVQWLVRLRWAEIVGQAATILAVNLVFGVELPLAALAGVVGLGLVSNLALEGVARRATHLVTERALAAIMALDVALLTVMLYLTGGPLNPFGFLYLVQIALATVLLRAAWTWTLVGLSFTCFGILLIDHRPLEIPDSTRMYGMWVALGVAAAFIVHFLVRITTALAQRETELATARNLAARQERLASLATMAAGAAHELSTPLSTVALVAKELERHLQKAGGDPQLVDDAKLIRGEVGRCRAILDQMAGGAGTVGESIEPRSVDELLDEALTGVRASPPIERDLDDAVARARVRLPPRAVGQALRSLVTNAQDASGAEAATVKVRVRIVGPPDEPQLRIEIVDRGPGMTPEVLARLGEPFFTTKQPGRGMGLGLFLARAVVEGVGGTLGILSQLGKGTTVTVVIPTEIGPAEAGEVPAHREAAAAPAVSKVA
jgi:two-component system sensor histidine kinase RegB